MTPTQTMMIRLLRLGMGFTSTPIALSRKLSEKEWRSIHREAHLQGVSALVWDGIQRLTPENRPPKSITIGWALETEEIEKRYFTQLNAAAQASTLLQKEQIPLMVFKGATLSFHYPTPSHRECGDIDIYCFGQTEAANRLMESDGAEVCRTPQSTHDHWRYQKALFENHRSFMDASQTIRETLIERRLNELLTPLSPTFRTINGISLLAPPSEFETLYVLYHGVKHLITEGITLRHLCDWAVLLQKNQPDLHQLRALFSNDGITSLVDSFNWMTIELFELPVEQYSSLPRHPKIEKRMRIELFKGRVVRFRTTSQGLPYLLFRLMNFFRRDWKVQLAYGEGFWRKVPATLGRFLRNPNSYLHRKRPSFENHPKREILSNNESDTLK